MRKVRVNLNIIVSEGISDEDIEEYLKGIEEDMQEHFIEMPFEENNEIYIDKIKINKN